MSDRDASSSRLRALIVWPGRLLAAALVLLIRGYQRLISPALGPSCRFTPSCSSYALESLQKRGVVVGLLKTAWRLLRCNPFGRGGYDPP